MTVLLTSLPVETAGLSEVVRSYFDRWPAQELQFKSMKSTVSLHRVAGYGKQKVQDEKIAERQGHAAKMINRLTEVLRKPLEDIGVLEASIAKLIPKERRLRNKSEIIHGKRELSEKLRGQLESYGKQIAKHEKEIKKIEKEHPDQFRLLRKHRREWLRLQGKETIYKVDVELDQIVTFHRVSLANLYAYFIKHFLGGKPMSMTDLLHKIIHLPATIKETDDVRKIILDYNKKDKLMMEKLSKAIEKIKCLACYWTPRQRMEFSLRSSCLKLTHISLQMAESHVQDILYKLGITDVPDSKVEILRILYKKLTDNLEQNKETLLIIDEAEFIAGSTLEEIRLFLNYQLSNRFLLTIFLGQPELVDKVKAIKQLAQRVEISYFLRSFNFKETTDYIFFERKRRASARMCLANRPLK